MLSGPGMVPMVPRDDDDDHRTHARASNTTLEIDFNFYYIDLNWEARGVGGGLMV